VLGESRSLDVLKGDVTLEFELPRQRVTSQSASGMLRPEVSEYVSAVASLLGSVSLQGDSLC
jgi:hypothetical protein